jgi:hypothetical protein
MTEDGVSLARPVDHDVGRGAAATATAPELGPISPELALVDPELAEVARRRLPVDGGTSAAPGVPPGATPAGGDDVAVPATASVPYSHATTTGVVGPKQRRPTGRRWRRRALVLGVVVGAGVAGLALSSHLSLERAANRDDRAGTGPHRRTSSSSRRRGTLPTSAVATSPTSAVATSPTTKQSAKPGPAGRRSVSRARPAPKPTPPYLPSTRLFIWPGVKHATHYKVEFFRRGRRVFIAWPSAPRLELPLRWRYEGRSMRLVRGVYSWRVSPAYGVRSHRRLGLPIVRSTWVAKT